MKYNLDFTNKEMKNKPQDNYISREEFMEVTSSIVQQMGKDMAYSNNKLSEFILEEKYNRQRDMAFILSILGGQVGKQKLTTLYFEFCKDFDKKHKKGKEKSE